MNRYSEKLRDPRWQRKRLLILNRDGWKCQCCNDVKTTLNVHHIFYSGQPWEAPDDTLVSVCEHCHKALEYCKKFNVEGFYTLGDVIKWEVGKTINLASISSAEVLIISITPVGISHVIIPANDFSRIMHQMINLWLFAGKTEFLKDPKI